MFTIVIVGALGSEQLQTTLFEAIDHSGDGNLYDSEASLLLAASGAVQLEYEVTRTDNDGDTVTVADQIDLITDGGSVFSFDDDGPVELAGTSGDMVLENELDTVWSTRTNVAGADAGTGTDDNATTGNDDTVAMGSVAALVNFGADGSGCGKSSSHGCA